MPALIFIILEWESNNSNIVKIAPISKFSGWSVVKRVTRVAPKEVCSNQT